MTIEIRKSYLLVSPIPVHSDADGIFLDPLWHHDLIAHFEYLRNVTLLAPRADSPRPPDATRVVPPANVSFRVVTIPPLASFGKTLIALPRLVSCLWKAIGDSEIVHSGVAGWPIALGWIANPIAIARNKKLVIVVESAFWRIPAGRRASWKARLREFVTEGLARWSVNRADLALFSQPAYRDSLHTLGRGSAYVTPATWINAEQVLGDAEAKACWAAKRSAPTGRVLFAGRLVADKGIPPLLEAANLLEREGRPVHLDVIGDGVLRVDCEKAASQLRVVRMRVLPQRAYGEPFFSLLREYDAVVIPSLSDEQPRIVYDAYSQAVPVIASRTDGLVACVSDGETGVLVNPGDSEALARALLATVDARGALEQLGMNALGVARGLTHRAMHATRAKILADCLGS